MLYPNLELYHQCFHILCLNELCSDEFPDLVTHLMYIVIVLLSPDKSLTI